MHGWGRGNKRESPEFNNQNSLQGGIVLIL